MTERQTAGAAPARSGATRSSPVEERTGFLLVLLAALAWSLGGMIARSVGNEDSWTVVFWRSVWAAAFLVGFMLWRDGSRGMVALFKAMGIPGLAVAACFATASTAFVVALAYTTVANVLLMQAAVPLMAAMIAFVFLGERITGSTWVAIAAVIGGIAIMVSDSLDADISARGDGLAVLIAVVFSVATVITRRYAHVRMTPAVCLGTVIAACFAVTQAGSLAVSRADMGFLVLFGAVNLGLGLALFATGARLIPAAWAALLATVEMILGPVWVWIVHDEVPTMRTLVGGGVVMSALVAHLVIQFRHQQEPVKPGETGVPAPH